MNTDEAEIRTLVATWMEATRAGDMDTVLGLMTDDVVFLTTGQAPMDKSQFAAALPGHPAMEILVNIDVARLEEAIGFYTGGLGLRLKRRLFQNTVAELEGAACPVLLLEKPAGSPIGPGAAQARTYQRHWTAVHLDFAVPALEPAVERAVRAGARLEADIQSYNWGRQALMGDPFGNGFCLVEWRNGGYAAVVSG